MSDIFLHFISCRQENGRIELRRIRRQTIEVFFCPRSSCFIHIGEVINFSNSSLYHRVIIISTNSAATMHHHRHVIRNVSNPPYDSQIQFRLFQVNSMCGAKRTSQKIYSCFRDKLRSQIRIRVNFRFIAISATVIRSGLTSPHGSQFCLHRCTVQSCHFHSFLCVRYIFFIRQYRAVIHNPRKTKLERFFQILQMFSVIQVNTDGDSCLLCRFQHCRSDEIQRYPFIMTLRKHQDYR